MPGKQLHNLKKIYNLPKKGKQKAPIVNSNDNYDEEDEEDQDEDN